MDNDKPCCANEALQRVTIVTINGIPTGIAMLQTVFDETRNMDIRDEARLKETLLENVKVNNYVPKDAGDSYSEAVVREYRNVKRTGVNEEPGW